MALRDAEGAGGEIMPAAELKPLLMLAKRQPVSCAIGLTKDKAAVIVLDRRMKPRKLMADLRSQARTAGVELDAVSVRFGRASVDSASDSGTVRITVNKEAPPVLGLKRYLHSRRQQRAPLRAPHMGRCPNLQAMH